MTGRSALVLFSGGLDSTVALWWTRDKGYGVTKTLSFRYGSREESISLDVCRALADIAGVEYIQLDLDILKRLAGQKSSLLGNGKITPGLDGPEMEATRAVWVPARNLVLVSIAASMAEVMGGDVDIVVGFDREEAETFPDNSRRFVENLNRVLEDAVLEGTVRVVSPLIEMRKGDIVRLGIDLGAPLELSCSCYQPSGTRDGKPIHCGTCQSCILRHRGFGISGQDDPTIYEVDPVWKS
jgi:7-cyano-7-deazaguanine synthase